MEAKGRRGRFPALAPSPARFLTGAALTPPPRVGTLAGRNNAVERVVIALIQRVSRAEVSVEDEVVGRIEAGLLALVAIEPGDAEPQVSRMLERLLGYRVFTDDGGRMNRSLVDTGGGLLLVSQFTLAADTRKGMRPSFTSAASPEAAQRGFDALVDAARKQHPRVETGRFGAHMQVSLVNDGPVTFLLKI